MPDPMQPERVADPDGEGRSHGKRVLLSWSGGKDSCLALRELGRTPDIRVDALLTTITRDFDRVSMHGVRRVLLERQAASLGLPLHQILISKSATNQEYEMKMGEAFCAYRHRGVNKNRLW
jgi:diphthamide synthase (EF-2-diphthine--ammonia ligase)